MNNTFSLIDIKYKVKPEPGLYKHTIELSGKVLIEEFNRGIRPFMEVEILQGVERWEGDKLIIQLNLPDEKVEALRKAFTQAVLKGNKFLSNN